MAKSKLHPIAAKHGFKSNEEFYEVFPDQESYEKAFGGQHMKAGGAMNAFNLWAPDFANPQFLMKKGGEMPCMNCGGSMSQGGDVHDKPGGSNVGKKTFADGSKRTGPYAGPSGGAPKGSYPIPDIKHARAALSLAHHAPDPEGIKSKVYAKFPELKKEFGGHIDSYMQAGGIPGWDPNTGIYSSTQGAPGLTPAQLTASGYTQQGDNWQGPQSGGYRGYKQVYPGQPNYVPQSMPMNTNPPGMPKSSAPNPQSFGKPTSFDTSMANPVQQVTTGNTFKSRPILGGNKQTGGAMTEDLEGQYPKFNQGGMDIGAMYAMQMGGDPSIPTLSEFSSYVKKNGGPAYQGQSQDSIIDTRKKEFLSYIKNNTEDALIQEMHQSMMSGKMQFGGGLNRFINGGGPKFDAQGNPIPNEPGMGPDTGTSYIDYSSGFPVTAEQQFGANKQPAGPRFADPNMTQAQPQYGYEKVQNPLADAIIAGEHGIASAFDSKQAFKNQQLAKQKQSGDTLGSFDPNANRGDYNQFGLIRPDEKVPVQNKGYNTDYNGISEYGGTMKGGGEITPNFWNASQLNWPIQMDKYSSPKISVNNTLQPVDREDANLEAEKGETAIISQGGVPAQFKIAGKPHTKGGTPLNLPDNSFIFSKTKAMKIKDPNVLAQFGITKKTPGGVSPADIAKKYDLNQYHKILSDPDSGDMHRKTAEMMIANYNDKLAKLGLAQESKKGFPQGIPAIAMPYVESMNVNPSDLVVTQGQQEDPDADMAEYGGMFHDGGMFQSGGTPEQRAKAKQKMAADIQLAKLNYDQRMTHGMQKAWDITKNIATANPLDAVKFAWNMSTAPVRGAYESLLGSYMDKPVTPASPAKKAAVKTSGAAANVSKAHTEVDHTKLSDEELLKLATQ